MQKTKRHQSNTQTLARNLIPYAYRSCFSSTNTGSVSVMIDGSTCTIDTVTDTQIECTTGSHLGSVEAKVEVQISGKGIAEEVCDGMKYYNMIIHWK